jgi:hypothetical protein
MGEPSNSRLERAMKGLTIGVVQDMQDWERIRATDALKEIEQQFWVEFSGRAEEFAAWSYREIEFEQHYVDATGQRDSPFDRPHFTYGAVIDTPTPVGVLAVVMEYRANERNETIGAKVAIGILATDRSVNVRGRVNLTFQGYGQAPSGLADDIGAG